MRFHTEFAYVIVWGYFLQRIWMIRAARRNNERKESQNEKRNFRNKVKL